MRWARATKSSALAEKSVSDLSSHQRSGVALASDRDRSLVVLAVLERRDLGEALLTEDLRSLLAVTVGLGEGLLGVHHAGPGRIAQRLDVLLR